MSEPVEEGISWEEALSLTQNDVSRMSREKFRALAARLVDMQQMDRKENALLYYKPVTDVAKQIHLSKAQTIGVGGGNGSSKTESCLVEMVICATGIVPYALRDEWDYDKFRGPIHCRIVCESLTNVLYPIILPKLQWFKWTGVDAPGGDRGHYGWIPRTSLIGGSWERSWTEKLRQLRFLCRDPHEPNTILGESTLQCMSIDQDETDFASGDYHIILHDEPPPHAIWRENQARTMRVRGRNLLAMTWPDDPSMPVDWLFDEVYEPGENPEVQNIEWINLYTTDNPMIDQEAVQLQMENWSAETLNVRIYGRPIRFSNRVHAHFTDQALWWCFDCRKQVVTIDRHHCAECKGENTEPYSHVVEGCLSPQRPTVYLLDPHPRKPHMMSWIQIDPQDDHFQVGELEVEGEPQEVARQVELFERARGLQVVRRLIDPNMGRSPSGVRRNVTWQDEFDKSNLRCDLADDSAVGRKTLDGWMQPDPDTRAPRFHIDASCPRTIHQFKRYVWDDFKRFADRDQKQTPKDKNDDFPTLWKYYANEDLTYRSLIQGAQYYRRREAPREPRAGRWAVQTRRA